jgi:dTDP-4-dehydrorhamnose 3,5-epimerase
LPITVSPLPIEGLLQILPTVFEDDRGAFFESYNQEVFARAGIAERFVQDNQSASRRGVLRGLHFQRRHQQGKLVRAVSGEIFDVAVDLRPDSPSFGKWASIILSGSLKNQLYIPRGFAHGSLALSDYVVFAYKCTDYYSPADEQGIRWDDPALDIAWPNSGVVPILSAKDQSLPAFDPKRRYFA